MLIELRQLLRKLHIQLPLQLCFAIMLRTDVIVCLLEFKGDERQAPTNTSWQLCSLQFAMGSHIRYVAQGSEYEVRVRFGYKKFSSRPNALIAHYRMHIGPETEPIKCPSASSAKQQHTARTQTRYTSTRTCDGQQQLLPGIFAADALMLAI